MGKFSELLAICAGNSPVPGEFPALRPVTRSFDDFFDLHPNKLLSKQWWGWWFETPSCPLRRHRNEMATILAYGNFKCIHLNGNDIIPIRISTKIVRRSQISLAPNRRQAITLTNAYLAHWCIYVAIGGGVTFWQWIVMIKHRLYSHFLAFPKI